VPLRLEFGYVRGYVPLRWGASMRGADWFRARLKSFKHRLPSLLFSTDPMQEPFLSEPEFAAVLKPSSRGFARALLLGGLLAAAALMTRNTAITTHNTVARHPMMQMMGGPQPVEPSAFDTESSMTPSQLLDRWDDTMTEASKRFHVPKAWIRAVMQRESGGRTMLAQNQPMVSSAGALGLMQVLPATYDEMRAQYRLGSNPFDAHDNILAGAAYLNWLHHKYGYPAMFAAYNAGPGRLEDHLDRGAKLPEETRAYIAGITQKLGGGKGHAEELAKLTQPDGAVVKLDPGQVTGIRAALPGEFADSVKAVITLGKHRQQAVREDVATATTAIRNAGLI
jgi:hypothetical protein